MRGETGRQLFKFCLAAIVVFSVLHTTIQKTNHWVECACLDGTLYVETNFQNVEQSDPRLIQYVRTRYLTPPAHRNTPYRFADGTSDKKTENGKWVRKFLKEQRNGFFIEAGANEGEVHSHTLDLEMTLNWTGILIECNPTVTPYLRTKKRKAWVAGVCLSTTEKPSVSKFSNPEKWTYSGRFGPAWDLPGTNWTYFDVESVPLYTIMTAAGHTVIDYFSLDVEGVEMEILETLPFDKVTIKLLVVEVYFLNATRRLQFEGFMHSKGFRTLDKNGSGNRFPSPFQGYLIRRCDTSTPERFDNNSCLVGNNLGISKQDNRAIHLLTLTAKAVQIIK